MPKLPWVKVEHKARVLSYTKLDDKCRECDQPAVCRVVYDVRYPPSVRIMSGQQSHAFCKEHTPDYVTKDIEEWYRYIQTPPGS